MSDFAVDENNEQPEGTEEIPIFNENDPMSLAWYTERMKAIPTMIGSISLERNRTNTAASVVLLSFIVWIWRRRSSKPTSPRRRPRLGSREVAGGGRPRVGSRDLSTSSNDKKRGPRNRERSLTEEMPGILEDLPDDLFAKEAAAHRTVLGPSVVKIHYETFTPPPSWSDASRQIVPKVAKHEIQCELQLELASSKLQVGNTMAEKHKHKDDEERQGFRIASVQDVSVHVQPPLEGGVLELKFKRAREQDKWMEHTFASAQMAAQFQQDILGSQVVGKQIQNMFDALQLIQQGSIASEGKEFVLHDTEAPVVEQDENKDEGKENAPSAFAGVAWDDAMRCFSALPSVKDTLTQQLVAASSRDFLLEHEQEDEPTGLAPLYVKKRLLLGQVDFFRLFVPTLPSSSLPNNESNPSRMEQLLMWRKRVARASVLVRSYVRAMKVVNQGWRLDGQPEDTTYLKRRLAFDDNDDNISHDSENKNEFYEATVSRDVRCDVHSSQHLTSKGSSIPSEYQAYSLVGCHCFQLPPKGQDHPLLHNKDPVLALPSLRRIIESNPEVDFFISAFYPEKLRVAMVLLFCRSLPAGVDKAFDTILDRYINGTREVRDRKMEVFIQLGPGAGLSPLAWAALKAFSALLSWTRRGEAAIPYETGGANVRTPFPGMTMSNYTETTSFGGSLQKDVSLPKNYVAVNAHVDGEEMGNMAARLLYQRLEEGALQASIVDFSFVLEGQKMDELPERVMASIRMVKIDAAKIALPVAFSESSIGQQEEPPNAAFVDAAGPPQTLPPARPEMSSWTSWNPFRSSRNMTDEKKEEMKTDIGGSQDLPQTIDVSSIDQPNRAGVQALWEILHGVTVPVRKEGLSEEEAVFATPLQPALGMGPLPVSVNYEDLVNFAVLRNLKPSDLQRYYVASDGDLKTAAVRIVESAAWRGVTFPIDTRVCRIELQTGQFFHQGRDKNNYPVFYFQNMCLGPWRKDVDAVIAAVVHRLETCIQRFAKDDPKVKCTVVILMGRPFHYAKSTDAKKRGESSEEEEEESKAESKEESKAESKEENKEENKEESAEESKEEEESSSWNPFAIGVNPRIDPGEDYYTHTNPTLVTKLVELLSLHYPERLSKALLVPGKGGSGLLGMTLGGSLGVRAYVPAKRTRAKVSILNNTGDLLKHIEEDELSVFVGGKAPVAPEAFDCKT